jgi:type I thyroxine 5'-deiodinase
VVYIQEAHPTDGWQLPVNVREQVLVANPSSDGEREGVASLCVRKLGIEIPALVDDIADSVEKAYTAWPDRLFVIDRHGKLAYKSKPGPFGFKPAEAERALKAVL